MEPVKSLLHNFVYAYRMVVLSALVRKASFCSDQWWLQELKTDQHSENKWLLNTQSQISHLYYPSPGREKMEEGIRRLWESVGQQNGMPILNFQVWQGYCMPQLTEAVVTAHHLHNIDAYQYPLRKQEELMVPIPLRIDLQPIAGRRWCDLSFSDISNGKLLDAL